MLKRQQRKTISSENESLMKEEKKAETKTILVRQSKSVENLSSPQLPLRSSSKSEYNLGHQTTNGIMQGQVWLPAIPIMFANTAGQVMVPHNGPGQHSAGNFKIPFCLFNFL